MPGGDRRGYIYIYIYIHIYIYIYICLEEVAEALALRGREAHGGEGLDERAALARSLAYSIVYSIQYSI